MGDVLSRWDLEPVAGDPERERVRRKRDLALGYRIFAALRWGDLGDGHISARDPEHADCFWLLGYGVSYHTATVADLVLVNPEGVVVSGDGDINAAAYHIHQPIHVARPDVVSAAHVHTPWGTPFSAERRPIEPITQEATIFFDDCSIFDDPEVQVLSTDGGARIAAALGSNRAVTLANHGILTVGASVAEAVAAFVTLERVAEAHMKARDAKPIPAEAAQVAMDDLTQPGALWQMFQWLLLRHVPDQSVVDCRSRDISRGA